MQREQHHRKRKMPATNNGTSGQESSNSKRVVTKRDFNSEGTTSVPPGSTKVIAGKPLNREQQRKNGNNKGNRNANTRGRGRVQSNQGGDQKVTGMHSQPSMQRNKSTVQTGGAPNNNQQNHPSRVQRGKNTIVMIEPDANNNQRNMNSRGLQSTFNKTTKTVQRAVAQKLQKQNNHPKPKESNHPKPKESNHPKPKESNHPKPKESNSSTVNPVDSGAASSANKSKRSHTRRLRQRQREKERRVEKKTAWKEKQVRKKTVLKEIAKARKDSIASMDSRSTMVSPSITFRGDQDVRDALVSNNKVMSCTLATIRVVVPREVVAILHRTVTRRGEYCVLEGDECEVVVSRVQEALKCFGNYDIDLERIRSVRRGSISFKNIKRHSHLRQAANTVWRLYQNQQLGVLAISRKLDFSPVSCFRIILERKSFGKAQIKKFTKNPDLLSDARDRQEMWLAANNDTCSVQNEHKVLEQAKTYEDLLERFFRSQNVMFQTESELQSFYSKQRIVYNSEMEKYKAELAKGVTSNPVPQQPPPCITPDLLFPAGALVVNGRQVNWIDAKNYFGIDGFLTKKTNDQVAKYYERWGPGAIVFKLGFAECLASKMNSVHCMLIDYENLVNATWSLSTSGASNS